MNFIYTEVPQTSPKNLNVSWTSISTAVISWTRLTLVEARGFITHYTVLYYTLSDKRELESNTMYKMVDKNLNSTVISGLDGKTQYIVRVSASTIAGEGKYSEFLLLTSYVAGKLISVFFPFLIIYMIYSDVRNSTFVTTVGIGVAVAIAILVMLLIICIAILYCAKNRRRHVKKKGSYSTFKKASRYFKRDNKDEIKNLAGEEIGTALSFKPLESTKELGDDQTYENTEFMSE